MKDDLRKKKKTRKAYILAPVDMMNMSMNFPGESANRKKSDCDEEANSMINKSSDIEDSSIMDVTQNTISLDPELIKKRVQNLQNVSYIEEDLEDEVSILPRQDLEDQELGPEEKKKKDQGPNIFIRCLVN